MYIKAWGRTTYKQILEGTMVLWKIRPHPFSGLYAKGTMYQPRPTTLVGGGELKPREGIKTIYDNNPVDPKYYMTMKEINYDNSRKNSK